MARNQRVANTVPDPDHLPDLVQQPRLGVWHDPRQWETLQPLPFQYSNRFRSKCLSTTWKTRVFSCEPPLKAANGQSNQMLNEALSGLGVIRFFPHAEDAKVAKNGAGPSWLGRLSRGAEA